jgi:hypothetical protein
MTPLGRPAARNEVDLRDSTAGTPVPAMAIRATPEQMICAFLSSASPESMA